MTLLPGFAQFIQDHYKAGTANSFILTGNIGDYVGGTLNLKDYLVESFLVNEEMRMENIFFYDVNFEGICVVGGEKKVQSFDWENLIRKMGQKNSRNAYVIFYPQFLLPAGEKLTVEEQKRVVSMHTLLNSTVYTNSQNLVIFIADSLEGINPLFLYNNSRIMHYKLELPNAVDRYQFIRRLLENKDREIKTSLTARQIANITSGLSYVSVEEIILTGIKRTLTPELILKRRNDFIHNEYGECISFMNGNGNTFDDYAGLKATKDYFNNILLDGLKNTQNQLLPNGILLMGPAGTGKTYFVRCFAGEVEINFVELKPTKVEGLTPDDRKTTMKRIIALLKSLAPVGVFIDELDQLTEETSNDSCIQETMEVLVEEILKEENRGKIMWFVTTDNPHRLQSTFQAFPYMEKRIPFLAPTEEDRLVLLEKYIAEAKDNGYVIARDLELKEIASKTLHYTSVELIHVVKKAMELSHMVGNHKITQELMQKAITYILPVRSKRVLEVEEVALEECNDFEFLPENYKKK